MLHIRRSFFKISLNALLYKTNVRLAVEFIIFVFFSCFQVCAPIHMVEHLCSEMCRWLGIFLLSDVLVALVQVRVVAMRVLSV